MPSWETMPSCALGSPRLSLRLFTFSLPFLSGELQATGHACSGLPILTEGKGCACPLPGLLCWLGAAPSPAQQRWDSQCWGDLQLRVRKI